MGIQVATDTHEMIFLRVFLHGTAAMIILHPLRCGTCVDPLRLGNTETMSLHLLALVPVTTTNSEGHPHHLWLTETGSPHLPISEVDIHHPCRMYPTVAMVLRPRLQSTIAMKGAQTNATHRTLDLLDLDRERPREQETITTALLHGNTLHTKLGQKY